MIFHKVSMANGFYPLGDDFATKLFQSEIEVLLPRMNASENRMTFQGERIS